MASETWNLPGSDHCQHDNVEDCVECAILHLFGKEGREKAAREEEEYQNRLWQEEKYK